MWELREISWKLYSSKRPQSRTTELLSRGFVLTCGGWYHLHHCRKVNYSGAPATDTSRSSNNTARTCENDYSVKMFRDKNKWNMQEITPINIFDKHTNICIFFFHKYRSISYNYLLFPFKKRVQYGIFV